MAWWWWLCIARSEWCCCGPSSPSSPSPPPPPQLLYPKPNHNKLLTLSFTHTRPLFYFPSLSLFLFLFFLLYSLPPHFNQHNMLTSALSSHSIRPTSHSSENTIPPNDTGHSNTTSSPPPPHIRIVPHLESSRSLVFGVIERDVRENIVIKIGRFTDRFLTPNRITFRSKVVSRGHAELWTEDGKVRWCKQANLPLSLYVCVISLLLLISFISAIHDPPRVPF